MRGNKQLVERLKIGRGCIYLYHNIDTAQKGQNKCSVYVKNVEQKRSSLNTNCNVTLVKKNIESINIKSINP